MLNLMSDINLLYFSRFPSNRDQCMDMGWCQVPLVDATHMVVLIRALPLVVLQFLILLLMTGIVSLLTRAEEGKETGIQFPFLMIHRISSMTVIVVQGLQGWGARVALNRALHLLANMLYLLLEFVLIHTTGWILSQIMRMQNSSSSNPSVRTMFIKVLNTMFGPAHHMETRN